ncbi:MAG: sulfatase-like hydrolase/transferase [Aureliella sp.]
MSRISIAVLLPIVLAAAVLPTAGFAAERPNIVLMMGDDHGWEETGYNGHPYVKTPVLDAMAQSGLRLDNFYAGHPTCSPTRGSFLTGRHPNRYGTFTPNFSMRPEEITIAQLLNQAGYRCGHFGKWHVGPVKKSSPTSPGSMGFGSWLSHDNFFELNPSLSRNGAAPDVIKGEGSEVIAAAAIEFMKQSTAAGEPFLTVIWFGSPHEPYSGLESDLQLYDDLPMKFANKRVRLTSNKTGRPVERSQREVLRERYAEITAMDRSIGFVQDHLSETGQLNNTLLLYCGDNGTPQEAVAESPLRGRKGQMYEGGIRVPGVICWPQRIKAPAISSVTTSTSDILPTLCSIVGIEAPKRPLDGIDLTPLFAGEMNVRPSPLYFWAYDVKHERNGERIDYLPAEAQTGTTPLVKLMGDITTRNFTNYVHATITPDDYLGTIAAIEGTHKLVVKRTAKRQTIELFDLSSDRAEDKDISESNKDHIDEMLFGLRNWQDSVLNSLTGRDYSDE